MFSLLRERDFGLLWLAGLISYAGNAALTVVFPLHVYRLTDSTLVTAIILATYFLPRVLFSSVAGVFVDRWDRKRTMIGADLGRAVVLLPILIAPGDVPLLGVVAVVQGTIAVFFAPAESALLPTLVGENRLVAANALNALNNNIGMLIGPAMGALLYAEFSFRGTVLADTATFIISASLIRLIVADARPEGSAGIVSSGAAWTRMASDWRAGMSVIRRELSLRVLLASSLLVSVAQGVFLTLGLSPLVLDVLGGTPAQVGWLGTAQAIGGITAGLIVVRIGHRMTTRWLYGGGLIGIGLADLGAANAARIATIGTPAVGVAMGWMIVAGFPVVAAGAGLQALVQTHTTDAYRGRVFGTLSSVSGIALIVGFAVGGVLGSSAGIVPVLSAAALLRALGGVVAILFLPRHPQQSSSTIESEASHVHERQQSVT